VTLGAALPSGGFLDRSRGVDTSDVDWGYIARVGLTDEEARCISYMSKVENHAPLYLRDLLAGYAVHDHEIVSFLVAWAYEESQHGRALDRVLSAAGRPAVTPTHADLMRGVSWAERLESISSRVLSRATPHFVAVHMAWGAASEMTAALAYNELAGYTRNRELARLLPRLAKDERRHQVFYFRKARERLASSSAARWFTRLVMGTLWGPVGDGVADKDDFGFIGALLFDHPRGRELLRGVDRTMETLPGLHGFDRASVRVAESIASFKRREIERTPLSPPS
jgi:hypothetical protein